MRPDTPVRRRRPGTDPARPRRWDGGRFSESAPPPAPEEAPVAIVIDGQSQAVLMATPHDLHDLALGFALSEGMIAAADAVAGFETAAPGLRGLPAHEARLWLRPGIAATLAERRRHMLGPVGCGLCGIEQLDQALPPVIAVDSDLRLTPAAVAEAMQALTEGQARWRETPAIHAAAFIGQGQRIVREDVGRHNALDKLIGALARRDLPPRGIIAMTSRLSVDLVQKAARIGAPVLIGAGSPTTLAIAWAESAGITLIGRARAGQFDLYTRPDRLEGADHG